MSSSASINLRWTRRTSSKSYLQAYLQNFYIIYKIRFIRIPLLCNTQIVYNSLAATIESSKIQYITVSLITREMFNFIDSPY